MQESIFGGYQQMKLRSEFVGMPFAFASYILAGCLAQFWISRCYGKSMRVWDVQHKSRRAAAVMSGQQ